MSRQRKIFLRNQQVRQNVPFFNPKFHFFFAQKCLMVIRMFNRGSTGALSSMTCGLRRLYYVLLYMTYTRYRRHIAS